eukprot:ctg_1677.g553
MQRPPARIPLPRVWWRSKREHTIGAQRHDAHGRLAGSPPARARVCVVRCRRAEVPLRRRGAPAKCTVGSGAGQHPVDGGTVGSDGLDGSVDDSGRTGSPDARTAVWGGRRLALDESSDRFPASGRGAAVEYPEGRPPV